MGKSAMIKVQVINKEGTIIAEAAGTKEVNLPVSRTYEEGDRVVFLADETPAFYVFQADDALGEALVYVTGEVSYEIPFGEKKVCYSPKIFCVRVIWSLPEKQESGNTSHTAIWQ